MKIKIHHDKNFYLNQKTMIVGPCVILIGPVDGMR